MKLIESQTFKNLAKSFAGECQALVRYRFIEYGARMQQQKTMAELIDKLGYNEFNHARMFYTFIQDATKDTIKNINIEGGYPFKEKWDLEQNLLLASEDEKEEGTKIYPMNAKIARDEGFDEIATLFENVAQVELEHHRVLKDMYLQMKNKSIYKKTQKVMWKCSDCGYEAIGKEVWQECPLCKAKQGSAELHIEQKI